MHNLVVGTTGSGKSVLCKQFASKFKCAGIKVGVLDIMQAPDWQADFVTDSPEEFLAWAKQQKAAQLFIDESGSAIGRYNKPMEWLAIQARHWGHDCWFVMQGITQLSTIVRDNCEKAYVFACGDRSMESLAENFRAKELRRVGRFARGDFMIVHRFEATRWGRLEFPKKRVDLLAIPVRMASSGQKGCGSEQANPPGEHAGTGDRATDHSGVDAE